MSDSIKNQVIDLLTENTGKALGDSGDAYGRHWESNQNKEFSEEPRLSIEVERGGTITTTVSLYHYLCELLEEDDVSMSINYVIQEDKNYSSIWITDVINIIQEACDKLGSEVADKEIEDIIEHFGDLDSLIYFCQDSTLTKDTKVWNTYNHDSNLSQVIQFSTFTYRNNAYILLEVHNGCDVRGGYTKVKCFKLLGLPMGLVDIYGTIDGKEVSNMYDGINLTYEDSPVEFNLNDLNTEDEEDNDDLEANDKSIKELQELYDSLDVNLDFSIVEVESVGLECLA